MDASDYGLAADVLAVVHAAFVLFVVGGQGLILVGWRAGWSWTRGRLFRWCHLGAIGIVVAQVLVGAYCPLTVIEARWRRAAAEEGPGASFIGYWIDRLIYYDVPLWQMHVLYVLFAALVVWTFVRYPPRRR